MAHLRVHLETVHGLSREAVREMVPTRNYGPSYGYVSGVQPPALAGQGQGVRDAAVSGAGQGQGQGFVTGEGTELGAGISGIGLEGHGGMENATRRTSGRSLSDCV